MAEHGMLVRIKLVMSQLATGHPTDSVDKVAVVQIFEPVLIRVMSVGTTMEVRSQRVFNSVLITSILKHS